MIIGSPGSSAAVTFIFEGSSSVSAKALAATFVSVEFLQFRNKAHKIVMNRIPFIPMGNSMQFKASLQNLLCPQRFALQTGFKIARLGAPLIVALFPSQESTYCT